MIIIKNAKESFNLLKDKINSYPNKLIILILKLLISIVSFGIIITIIIIIIFNILNLELLNIYPLGFPIKIKKIRNYYWIYQITLIVVGMVGYILTKIYGTITEDELETKIALSIMEEILSPLFNIIIIIMGIIIGSTLEDKLMNMELIKKIIWILWIYISPTLITIILNIKLLMLKLEQRE